MPNINDEIKYIKDMISSGMYDISPHVLKRMNERNLFISELENIILENSGTLAKNQGSNKRYEFNTNLDDKIIVALGDKMFIPVIVTVIKGGI